MEAQDAIEAEFLAIARAIEFCVSNPDILDKTISFSSDSREVVEWLNGSSFNRDDLLQLLLNTRSNLSKMRQTSVIYNSRGSNTMANSLAKSGACGGANMVTWSIILLRSVGVFFSEFPCGV